MSHVFSYKSISYLWPQQCCITSNWNLTDVYNSRHFSKLSVAQLSWSCWTCIQLGSAADGRPRKGLAGVTAPCGHSSSSSLAWAHSPWQAQGSKTTSRANKVQCHFCWSKSQSQVQIYPVKCEFAFVCIGCYSLTMCLFVHLKLIFIKENVRYSSE